MIAIIINTQMIYLISSQTIYPTIERLGYANVETWYDGTLIYAHNYLSGAEFYKVETLSVLYADGSMKYFEAVRQTVTTGEEWQTTLLEYSTPQTITLATCHPIQSDWRWVVELKEVYRNDNSCGHNSQSC